MLFYVYIQTFPGIVKNSILADLALIFKKFEIRSHQVKSSNQSNILETKDKNIHEKS